jgi:hypothetical protein
MCSGLKLTHSAPNIFQDVKSCQGVIFTTVK